jgi:LmbE family N-acetylglucosaminyl deacetylase
MSKVMLVCAPHTDDAELGCGGTIARFSEEGWTIHVAAFSNAEQSLPAGSAADRLEYEMVEALSVLGVNRECIHQFRFPVRLFSENRQPILDTLIGLRSRIQPDLVALPASQDVHQDHAVVHAEGLRAFRGSSIWGYELPWNHLSTETTGFVRLERRHIDRKLASIRCYTSQLELARPYFEEGVMLGLAAVRGVQIKASYAEAFQVLRSIV